MTATTTQTIARVGTFDRVALASALTNAVVVASDDYSRPILCAAYVVKSGADTIDIVATDSYRLVVTTVRDVDGVADFAPVLIEDLKNLVAAVKRSDLPTVSLTHDSMTNTASVWAGDIGDTPYPLHTVPTNEGQFPKYEGLIPSAEAFDGPVSFMPAFNGQFIGDIAKLCDPEIGYTLGNRRDAGPVRMYAIDALKPALFTIGGPAGAARVTYLLMPVRVQN